MRTKAYCHCFNLLPATIFEPYCIRDIDSALYFLILKLLGEEGAAGIKRAGEAPGSCERSH